MCTIKVLYLCDHVLRVKKLYMMCFYIISEMFRQVYLYVIIFIIYHDTNTIKKYYLYNTCMISVYYYIIHEHTTYCTHHYYEYMIKA